MDFKKVLCGSRRYNFHTHTQFCDGHATMEQMAAAAVEQGFTHIGFTPHSPLAIESPCNMSKSDVPLYLAELRRLERLYVNRCRFYAGMEIDYLSDAWGPHITYFRELPLDFRIGSVHFIPTKDGRTAIDMDGRPERFAQRLREYFDNDLRYVVNTFFSQTRRMILAGGFDIIGHLDKIGHNASAVQPGIENEHWYRRRADEIVDLVISRGITVEINTKAYEQTAPADDPGHPFGAPEGEGRIFPSRRLISRLKAAGVPIIVNSDAHSPERLQSGRDAAFMMLAAPPARISGPAAVE